MGKFTSIGSQGADYAGIDAWIASIGTFATECGLNVIKTSANIHLVAASGIFPGYSCANDDRYTVTVSGPGVFYQETIVDQIPFGCLQAEGYTVIGINQPKEVVLAAVVNAVLIGLGSGGYGPGATAPDPEFPTFSAAKIIINEEDFRGPLNSSLPTITIGGNLGVFVTVWRGGGYIIRTRPDLDSFPLNYLDLYLSQETSGFAKLKVKLAKDLDPLDAYTNTDGTTLTDIIMTIDTCRAYGDSKQLYIVNSTATEWLCLCSCFPANTGSENEFPNTEVGFGLVSQAVRNFGNGIVAHGVWGYFRLNGTERISAVSIGFGEPSVVIDRSGNSQFGIQNKWEGGYANIAEPWVAFSIGSSASIGRIVGMLYNCISLTASYGSEEEFEWDGIDWKVFTLNSSDGVFTGPVGSLAFVLDPA